MERSSWASSSSIHPADLLHPRHVCIVQQKEEKKNWDLSNWCLSVPQRVCLYLPFVRHGIEMIYSIVPELHVLDPLVRSPPSKVQFQLKWKRQTDRKWKAWAVSMLTSCQTQVLLVIKPFFQTKGHCKVHGNVRSLRSQKLEAFFINSSSILKNLFRKIKERFS